MNFSMPSTFPQDTFQEFRKLASKFFSDENLCDPFQKQRHFELAWFAVRYRYRACSEHNEAFKALLDNATDLWREWGADEEQNYRLEQCLYHFFMNCLSVFDSLVFCLYFVGGMVDPKHFAHVSNPKSITLKTTTTAFMAAFPHASINNHLRELSKDSEFSKIEATRNILAHRLTGRRNVHSCGTTDSGGTYTQTREEIWYIPGSNEELAFDENLIQRHFEEVTRLLTTLISASLEFVQSEKREEEGGQ